MKHYNWKSKKNYKKSSKKYSQNKDKKNLSYIKNNIKMNHQKKLN